MIVPVYLGAAAFAAWLSYQAITRQMDPRMAGAPATVLWFVVAQYSLAVEIAVDTGTVTRSYVPLAIMSAVFGLIMLLFTTAGVMGKLTPKEATRYGSDRDTSGQVGMQDPDRSREPDFGAMRQADASEGGMRARGDRSAFSRERSNDQEQRFR
jgi:hypothetical protein